MRAASYFPVIVSIVAVIVMLMASFSVVSAIPSENYSTTPPEVGDPDTYPDYLDLRDKGLVTCIKQQHPYGTCWAHAAISCCETNLIKKGYVDNTIDLSELHLAYFMFHRSVDPQGGLIGDTVTAESFLTSGANDMYSTLSMSSWRGIALEKDVPYEWSSIPDLHLGTEYEYSYTKYIITDVTWININDMGAVKKFLNGGDSVAFSYYASDDTAYKTIINDDGSRTVTYYCGDSTKITNRDVTIIGYDDNYPAENFSQEVLKNGAWLVKNSWGTEDERVGSDGTVWISYYTSGLDTYAAYNVELASAYDHNYQYDGGGSQHQNITYGNTGYMSNVFTSTRDEVLKAVSFYTGQNINVDYEIQVYTKLTDPNDPSSGVREFEKSQMGSVKYSGYHTVPLDVGVPLKNGESFSIVIKLTDNTGDVYLAVDTSVKSIDPYSPDKIWAINETFAKAGQSFASADGIVWEDIGADGTSNLRIKAFTEDVIDEQNEVLIGVVIAGVVVLTIIACIGRFN